MLFGIPNNLDCKLNDHPRHAPTQDEKPYAIEALALGDVDPLWYCESAVKPTREPPEPRIVAFEHAEQSRDEDAPASAGALWRVFDGASIGALLWAGRAQEDGGGLRSDAREEGTATAGGADLRDHDEGASGFAGLVGSERRHPRGDGKHGDLLEADFLCVGGLLHLLARERRAHRPGPWAEDGCQGLRMDRAVAGAWALAGELRARGADPGPEGLDAIPQGADPGADASVESAAQGVGGRRDQAGVGGDACVGSFGSGDDAGADRGDDRSRSIGGPRQGSAAGE